MFFKKILGWEFDEAETHFTNNRVGTFRTLLTARKKQRTNDDYGNLLIKHAGLCILSSWGCLKELEQWYFLSTKQGLCFISRGWIYNILVKAIFTLTVLFIMFNPSRGGLRFSDDTTNKILEYIDRGKFNYVEENDQIIPKPNLNEDVVS